MDYKKLFNKILEQNISGPGGVFGDASSMGHGGAVGNQDFYATGDARVPKVLGKTQTRTGTTGKKKKKKKLTVTEGESSFDELYKTLKKPEKDLSEYDQKELERGADVEMEHTTSRKIARSIAANHLDEDPLYYDKLAKVEKRA